MKKTERRESDYTVKGGNEQGKKSRKGHGKGKERKKPKV